MNKLFTLSKIVLFLPNLLFSAAALLSKLASSPGDRAGTAMMEDIFFIAGVAVLAATVGRLLSGKRSLLVPIAWLGPLCISAIGVLILLESNGGKSAILGLGIIIVSFLATLICIKISKFLAWTASRSSKGTAH